MHLSASDSKALSHRGSESEAAILLTYSLSSSAEMKPSLLRSMTAKILPASSCPCASGALDGALASPASALTPQPGSWRGLASFGVTEASGGSACAAIGTSAPSFAGDAAAATSAESCCLAHPPERQGCSHALCSPRIRRFAHGS